MSTTAVAMTSKELRVARSLHFEQCKARNVALARQVSAALRKAGLTKASAYKSFGRDTDGFTVITSTDVSELGERHFPKCTVAFTNDGSGATRSDQPEMREAFNTAEDVLVAMGVQVELAGRCWNLYVTRQVG